ncbi:MAG: terminase small subunit [Treponema sp.]|nr:terminase small subunit [Treponema sp.]
MEKEKKKRNTKTASQPQAGSLAAYDWGEEKLTEKQRQFIFYFTWPGQDGFHCAMRAAKKAGYGQAVVNSLVYKMLRDPKIQKLIQRFEGQAKASVHDAAQRFIQEKIIRADYDVVDYYTITEHINEKTGEISKKFGLKDLEILTKEQRLCIDEIDAKGQQSTPVFIFADRQKERDSIIALDATWNGGNKGNEYDVEETKEIIMERITIRQERRMKQSREDDLEIIDTAKNNIGEEV